MSQMLRTRPPALDVIVAAALCFSSQVELWAPRAMIGTSSIDGSRPLLAVTAAIGTLALVGRRTVPLASSATVFAAYGIQGILTTPTQGLTALIALVLSAYSLAAHAPFRRALAGGAFAALAVAALASDLADWAFAFGLVAASWAAGVGMQRRTALAELLRKRTVELERERDEAVRSERARIARELHDIVAHRVTTMVVQAQVADAQLAVDDEQARAALGAVEASGRQALEELRRLLGLLRDESEAERRGPQPGLQDIEALIAQTRAAGLSVELRVEGDERRVGPGLSLAAYRVVQEALTNVFKHGGRAPTDVLISYGAREIRVAVHNRGGGSENGSVGAGHGLIGMRERVSLYGGTLTVGEPAGGGFAVEATFPRKPSS